VKVDFHESPRSSVGIEWELFVVDAETGALAPGAPDLIRLVRGGDDRPIRKEYLPCVIELVSEPRRVVADAVADLREHRDEVLDAASSLGLALIGAGTHPFSRSEDQEPIPIPRYQAVAHENGWWGRQMAICGTHVHVGVADQRYVLPMTWTYSRFYPYLLALSASSPYWEGEDTAFASQRTMMFQQLPTNGLPYLFSTWAEFESYIDDAIESHMIEHADELRWDVRPSPKFGTVENRIPDCVPTLAELGCLAALTQCLGEYFERAFDEGEGPDYLAPWLVRENKWRVARYGLDATIMTPDRGTGRTHALREGLAERLEQFRPIAEDLGCATELAFAYDILERGASYERQRRVAGDPDAPDVRAVARLLMEETAAEAPAWGDVGAAP